jgi:hypothetical protein
MIQREQFAVGIWDCYHFQQKEILDCTIAHKLRQRFIFQRSGFKPKAVHVGFVMDKVSSEHDILRTLPPFSVNNFTIALYLCIMIYVVRNRPYQPTCYFNLQFGLIFDPTHGFIQNRFLWRRKCVFSCLLVLYIWHYVCKYSPPQNGNPTKIVFRISWELFFLPYYDYLLLIELRNKVAYFICLCVVFFVTFNLKLSRHKRQLVIKWTGSFLYSYVTGTLY